MIIFTTQLHVHDVIAINSSICTNSYVILSHLRLKGILWFKCDIPQPKLSRYVTTTLVYYNFLVKCAITFHWNAYNFRIGNISTKKPIPILDAYVDIEYSRTSIIWISIIRTLGYPNAILNYKIPKDDLTFCRNK